MPEDFAKIIAKNLKRLAYENNKTQTEIAKETGINKQTLSTWMNGQRIPRIHNIDHLCEYFHCERTDITEPYLKPLITFSPFERNLVMAYRSASDDNKRIVKFALGLVEGDER